MIIITEDLQEEVEALIARYGVDDIVKAAAKYMTKNAEKVASRGFFGENFAVHGQRKRGEILSIVAEMFKHVDRGYNGE